MMKSLLIGCFVLGLVYWTPASAGEIVVLTKTPIERFVLPSGEVLKNAYVWRRSAQGLMVLHDGGSYFLNFSLMPDDWKVAYGLKEGTHPEKEASSSELQQLFGAPTHKKAADKKSEPLNPDPYYLIEVLRTVKGLSTDACVFYTTPRYAQDRVMDEYLLAVGLTQSALNKDLNDVRRFKRLLDEHFPASTAPSIDELYPVCEKCGGDGKLERVCTACDGDGKCSRCDGKGERLTGIGEETMYCTTCRGTGKCASCRGTGTLSRQCLACAGKGRILDREACLKYIEEWVAVLQQHYRDVKGL